jgi:hypothetical protein
MADPLSTVTHNGDIVFCSRAVRTGTRQGRTQGRQARPPPPLQCPHRAIAAYRGKQAEAARLQVLQPPLVKYLLLNLGFLCQFQTKLLGSTTTVI